MSLTLPIDPKRYLAHDRFIHVFFIYNGLMQDQALVVSIQIKTRNTTVLKKRYQSAVNAKFLHPDLLHSSPD